APPDPADAWYGRFRDRALRARIGRGETPPHRPARPAWGPPGFPPPQRRPPKRLRRAAPCARARRSGEAHRRAWRDRACARSGKFWASSRDLRGGRIQRRRPSQGRPPPKTKRSRERLEVHGDAGEHVTTQSVVGTRVGVAVADHAGATGRGDQRRVLVEQV